MYRQIDEVAIPDSLKIELVSIQDSMMNTFYNNRGWDYTCGYFPRPELDCFQDIYWETFSFIAEINEVIHNLNLIINELSFLVTYPALWESSIKIRLSKKYSINVRTYFYEVFRTREIYNNYLKYLKKKKLLRKIDIKNYQAEFMSIFNDLIAIRNKMVHDTFSFPGIKYQTLLLTEIAADNNMALSSHKSGEIVSARETIKTLCDEFYEVAYASGTALVKYFEAFSHGCYEVTVEIQEGECDFSDE